MGKYKNKHFIFYHRRGKQRQDTETRKKGFLERSTQNDQQPIHTEVLSTPCFSISLAWKYDGIQHLRL